MHFHAVKAKKKAPVKQMRTDMYLMRLYLDAAGMLPNKFLVSKNHFSVLHPKAL